MIIKAYEASLVPFYFVVEASEGVYQIPRYQVLTVIHVKSEKWKTVN